MINDVIETLRPKTETVEIRLPIPGTSDVFAFEFAIIPDYVQYKRVYEDARRFGEKIISPATKQLYGDDLVEDIATAGSCHVYAKLMRSVKRISISDEGEQLVGDPGDPWSVREWMKFAKHCGPMFLMIEAQIMEKIVGAAATGEHDQVELAKKKSEATDSFEPISRSDENADSATPGNGVTTHGETPEISTHSQ